jgi:hypothetical protein
LAEGETIDRK